MGIFDAFVTSSGTEMTLAELSSKTKGDVELLSMGPSSLLDSYEAKTNLH